MNKAGMGNAWEKLAENYLKENGIRIICRNFKSYRGGEIDLVGCDRHGTLIFFEVKYRKSAGSGYPQEAVTRAKQKSICRASDYYRARHGISENIAVRYDVVAILGNDICWYKNAFGYS